MDEFKSRPPEAAVTHPPAPSPAFQPKQTACLYCEAVIFLTPAGFWSVTGKDSYEVRTDIRCEEAPEGRHVPGGPGDELDRLVTRLACAILCAAFAEYGITPRAFDMAAEAVLASDAFPRPADGSLLAPLPRKGV